MGRIVSLRRSGKSWSGLCPFHRETDGSFHVYEDNGQFYCFGCGAKGDIITFYEKYYNLTFLDACERLAKEYGIDWAPGRGGYSRGNLDAFYEVNRLAGSMYYEAMKQEGNPALSYLLGRGIDRKTISKFRIGYADGSGRMVSARVEGDAAMRKAAEDVGLIHKLGGRYRDRFESRVMFPIVNTRGKAIGFGGRDIDGKSKAKYINSAASRIYVKGANLYGLNTTRRAISEQGFVILVEGYMDLVALYMHGVTNVCAQLGTAFTPQQAKLLGRYTKNVVLALDSDESGQNAAVKCMDILAEAGVKGRVLILEGAKDPDDFIQSFGREAFDEAVKGAAPMYDYRLERMKRGFDLAASDGLADYLKAAAEFLAKLSPVEQELYKNRLAQEFGVSEAAISLQVQVSRKAAALPAGDAKEAKRAAPTDELFRVILGLALGSETALDAAAGYRHLFEGTEYSGLMTAMILQREQAGAQATGAELVEMLDDDGQQILELAQRAAAARGADESQIGEYLIKLELAALEASAGELAGLLDQGDEESRLAVMQEFGELQKQIRILENEIRNGKRGE
ncbi:MAG: DNA primase [Clostridiales bacterium]|nr:DNA primase [Clostridiales bacterium]